jgi:hypothetical protein
MEASDARGWDGGPDGQAQRIWAGAGAQEWRAPIVWCLKWWSAAIEGWGSGWYAHAGGWGFPRYICGGSMTRASLLQRTRHSGTSVAMWLLLLRWREYDLMIRSRLPVRLSTRAGRELRWHIGDVRRCS